MSNVRNAVELQSHFLDLGLSIELPEQMGGASSVGKHVTLLLDKEDTGPGRDAVNTPGGFARDPARLAPPRQGNAAHFFITGEKYFEAVYQAISKAQEHVWIAGWQVAWDVELQNFGSGRTRLIDVIQALNPKKVDVRFMIFGTQFDVPPIDDSHVAKTLQALGCKVLRAKGESDFSERIYSYFSHHQKCVIIDGKVAFLGGLDLAHGRRDDHTFPVVVDPQKRRINEMYNACVPPTREMSADELKWVSQGIQPGGAREPYGNAAKKVLDHNKRPRQPWQDVHLQIEGPAVFDVVTNYVRRWNGLTELPPKAYWVNDRTPPQVTGEKPIQHVGSTHISQYLPDKIPSASQPGVTVQILRSASADQNSREQRYSSMLPEAMRGKRSGAAQVDIQEAMLWAIEGAQHFIYIENQYFISKYGAEQVVDANGVPIKNPTLSDELRRANDAFAEEQGWLKTKGFYGTQTHQTEEVSNLIVQALGGRIAKAIREDKPFHVYLMIPLHSEGLLNSPMIMGVMHLTMQTLTFGTHSLINLIKRALVEKALGRSLDEIPSDELTSRVWGVPESEWSKYLTVLHARNFGQIPNGPMVSEQIYVHSKCLVADDNVAIIGSANINDRSLMGDRDSEIAAMVVDSASMQANLNGLKPSMVRGFARELRRSLWAKHLGWLEELPPSGAQPADVPKSVVDAPASEGSIRAIQRLARANSVAYEGVMPWLPRNSDERRKSDRSEDDLGSSIWPGWREARDDEKQPWSDRFSYPGGASIDQLVGKVKGFWCSYPYMWTQGQNNYDRRIALEFLSNVKPSEANTLVKNNDQDRNPAAG